MKTIAQFYLFLLFVLSSSFAMPTEYDLARQNFILGISAMATDPQNARVALLIARGLFEETIRNIRNLSSMGFAEILQLTNAGSAIEQINALLAANPATET